MKNTSSNIIAIASVQKLHEFLGLSSPLNPLITVIDHALTSKFNAATNNKLSLDLFNISIKRSFKGQLKYGKNTYDFDSGSMSFIAPNQIIGLDNAENINQDGWSLLFHPDLIRAYPLGKIIKNYGYFSYEENEALHLSEEEERTIESIVDNIKKEIHARLDRFSQDVLVSNLELLLSYANQFISRKMASNDLLSQFELLLKRHFAPETMTKIPTVEELAVQLHVSAAYLSDMLRSTTGQNTQQHIHNQIIEKAKHILTTTTLSSSEIAYALGFEYPQSFSKLFKNKTTFTPTSYRKSFH
jgi:AraC family transcriptional activator of pobA